MAKQRQRLGIGAVAVLVAALGAAYLLLNRDPQYDRSFDTAVAEPAYPDGGPLVLYDEGHLNTHTADRGYRPFVSLLRNDGYRVEAAGPTRGRA